MEGEVSLSSCGFFLGGGSCRRANANGVVATILQTRLRDFCTSLESTPSYCVVLVRIMGFFIVPFGLFSLMVSLIIGIGASSLGSMVLAHLSQKVWLVLLTWLLGAVSVGLLFWQFAGWYAPSPIANGAPGMEEWACAFRQAATYGAFPGIVMLGGGAAQLLRGFLMHKKRAIPSQG